MKISASILFMLILVCGCFNKAQVESTVDPALSPRSNSAQSVVDKQEEEQTSAEMTGFASVFTATPFCAVVSDLSINIQPTEDEPDYELHLYSVSINKMLKGEPREQITFSMEVEFGEDPLEISDQAILCLCQRGDEFFWPGTGCLFDYSDKLVQKAGELVLGNNPVEDKTYCND